jgi:polyketide cyclase/dehydrase/lipid transport protein
MSVTVELVELHASAARAIADRAVLVRARDASLAMLVAVVLGWAGGAAAADAPDTAWIDTASLGNGQVQVATRTDHQTVHIKLAIEVAAPREAVWEVLTACQIAPEYVPNVQSCRSVEKVDDGRAELFVQTVKPVFFLPTFEHVFRLDYEPYIRIGVHRVSGPLESMDGNWWLLPRADGKILLLYELAIDPGVPVPRFVVRATLKRDIPKIVTAVRDRAEGRH